MSVKQLRLSSQAKDQLIRLKTKTGIQQWNILCRWGFCVSLSEPSPPTPIDIPADSNVEMTWHVFGGEFHELYLALLKQRCYRDGLETTEDVLSRQFRLHVHRGISYLASPHSIRSITDLVAKTQVLQIMPKSNSATSSKSSVDKPKRRKAIATIKK